ncbi:MAG: hypothetical protein ACJA13_002460 [Paraglaciecola sp.]|jgi:hypothetical protein
MHSVNSGEMKPILPLLYFFVQGLIIQDVYVRHPALVAKRDNCKIVGY